MVDVVHVERHWGSRGGPGIGNSLNLLEKRLAIYNKTMAWKPIFILFFFTLEPLFLMNFALFILYLN